MSAAETWIQAETGHQLAIDGGQIVARNAKGKDLKSVPPAVKKTETYADLDALLGWLIGHEAECAGQVETWLLRSLPVPTAVLAEVWADDTWRAWLTDLVVIGGEGPEAPNGFLREATSESGRTRLGVVDLDGESGWIDAEEVTFPHPALCGQGWVRGCPRPRTGPVGRGLLLDRGR